MAPLSFSFLPIDEERFTKLLRKMVARSKKNRAVTVTKSKKWNDLVEKNELRLKVQDIKSKEAQEEEGEGGEEEGVELNPGFKFDIEESGWNGLERGWKLDSARKMLNLQNKRSQYTSIDEKIQKQIKKRKKEKEIDSEGEGEEEEEEEMEGMDFIKGSFIYDQRSDKKVKNGSESELEQQTPNEENGNVEEEQEDIIRHRENEKKKKTFFSQEPQMDKLLFDSFSEFNLSRPIMKALTNMGFSRPTPIQSKTIPIALMGRDICGSAMTGSGKTAAFVIPILERMLYRPKHMAVTRVIILTPTRELAVQCHSIASQLAQFTDIQVALAVGGLSNKVQEAELRKRPDIVIATPGRLIDHIRNAPSFNLDSIEILVVDEADRMLEVGFTEEIEEILRYCPKGRQTMLFSATMTDDVDILIKLSLNKPLRLFIDRSTEITTNLSQEFVRIRSTREIDREPILLALCSRTCKTRTIVFFKSKAQTHRMKVIFGLMKLKAAELHGNLNQSQRLEALEKFRDQEADYLLATDLAARGLDISGIENVINFNMPANYSNYVHRVGRTARAGRNGTSVTLVGESDRKILKQIIKNSKYPAKNRILPIEVVSKYKAHLISIEPQVKAIMHEEQEEKMLMKASEEVNRVGNRIKHEDEIFSRPARTWFQSNNEKAKLKDKSQEKYEVDMGLKSCRNDKFLKKDGNRIKRGPLDGLSREKKRRQMTRMDDVKGKRQVTSR